VAEHVLITGFEPFGGHSVNPSELVARALDGRVIGGRLICGRVLPVRSGELEGALEAAISQTQPDLVVCTGVAGGRNAIALERVAVNVLDFKIADNDGNVHRNRYIRADGPDARFSNLPLSAILEAWRRAEIPAYISNSAGTFLCNQAIYHALSLTQNAGNARAGFVHFPYLPSQAIAAGAESTPSMSLDLMQRAVELLIETTVPLLAPRREHHVEEARR